MQSIQMKRGQTITLTANPTSRFDHMALSDVALHNRKMSAFDPRRIFVTHLI